MKKIRNGIAGEITFEIFKTWFPDEPEVILMDFLKTENPEIICVKRLNSTDVGITRINRKCAQKLLNEARSKWL